MMTINWPDFVDDDDERKWKVLLLFSFKQKKKKKRSQFVSFFSSYFWSFPCVYLPVECKI